MLSSENEELEIKRTTNDISSKRRRKSAPKTDSNYENHIHAQKFISKMKDCVISDNTNISNSKPGTSKLTNLDLLFKTCLNKKKQKSLIENDILSVIKMWLEPLPDTSLPNLLIRKSLLQLLMNVRIGENDLKNSQIGKIVHFYSLNPNENVEVKKLAKGLIQKWTKVVLSSKNFEE